MSNNNDRQSRPTRSIRGPQSALTDFLASQNISANRIRADADARRAAAASASNANGEGTNGSAAADSPSHQTPGAQDDVDENDDDMETRPTAASRARTQKRKQQEEAIAKIKKTKAFKKRKRDADDSDSDDLAMALFNEKKTPMPGQMENCEICNKRFTVTPYSRSGPNGGLLCPKCGKDLEKDDKANKNKNKKKAPNPGGRGRRKVQSNLLDGIYQVGAKNLVMLCIETLTKNIDLADDLGDLPPEVVDRIARLTSKRRLLNPRTLDLFLQPRTEVLNIYDGALLSSDDYIRIFSTASKLRSLKVRNGIQFQDRVMEYLIGRNLNLEDLYLHGSNLLSESCWKTYLETKGKHLRSLRVYYTDKHIGDGFITSVRDNCSSLNRLKIYHNQQVTDTGVECIADLPHLEHLGLDLRQKTSTKPYVRIIEQLGKKLRTFSITRVHDLDDRLLDAMHEHCTSLSKLRITENALFTDAAFVRLFSGWKNKPLVFVDLEKCAHSDASNPRENEHLIGLCGDGFRALMQHSGDQLRQLNLHGCRHIPMEVFEEVFSGDAVYPNLKDLEISFCEQVTDLVVGCIFRSCPNLKNLNVHGCMKLRDVRVPKGKILVGMPNAMGMVIEGRDD